MPKGPLVFFAWDEASINKVAKQVKLPTEELLPHRVMAGWVQEVTQPATGGQAVVVYIPINEETAADIPQLMATMVHESVHVKQRFFKHIGERKPGREQEAYQVEAIFMHIYLQALPIIQSFLSAPAKA